MYVLCGLFKACLYHRVTIKGLEWSVLISRYAYTFNQMVQSSKIFKLCDFLRHHIYHAILVHTSRVNLEEHGSKVGTVRQSPVNLVGQNKTKSVYSTISSLLQSTLILASFYLHDKKLSFVILFSISLQASIRK